MKTKYVGSRNIVCAVLALMLGMTSFGAAFANGETVPADAGQERLVYQSSENFTITEDGTWDNGVWSAQVYDGYAAEGETPTYTYTNITTGETEVDKWGSSGVEGDKADIYKAPAKNSSWSAQRVGAYWIAPAANSGQENDSSVKTFTAPRNGIVTVTFGEQFKQSGGEDTYVRIVLEKDGGQSTAKLWPVEEEYCLFDWSGQSRMDQFTPFALNMQKGDKLHFEIKRASDTTNTWSRVYWDPVITYSDPAEARDFYQSSEHFITEETLASDTGVGTWDGGVWSAQYYDNTAETKTYMNITGAAVKKESYDEESTAGAYGYAYATPNIGDQPGSIVGAYWMTPVIKLAYTNSQATVKTFTAPKSGLITVACGQDKFGKTAGRIILTRIVLDKGDGSEPEQIWPMNGEYFKMQVGGYQYAFEPFSIQIQQGDMLHFEVIGSSDNTADVWDRIYWDPTIAYSNPGDTYQASEAFNTSRNGDPFWTWQYYDLKNKEYRDLTGTNKEISGFSESGEAGAAWIIDGYGASHSLASDVRSVAVGQYYMRTEMNPDTATDEEKKGEIVRDYAVRTFTAPRRGVVRVSADGLMSSGGASVRITRQRAGQDDVVCVWPQQGEWTQLSGDYSFQDLNLTLHPGDQLRFESAYQFSGTSPSPWSSKVRWDPVITYEAGVYQDEIAFSAGENVLSDFAGIAGTDNVQVTIPVFGGAGLESVVALVGIYDANNVLVKGVIGEETAVEAGQDTNLTVDLGTKAGIDRGSIKIYLFDSMEALNPVSNIGSAEYLKAQ